MTGLWGYVAVFLASLGVDLIPIVAPPAWTLMVFFMVQFHLNPWWVLLLGVVGSTLGRYLFGLYVPLIAHRLIKAGKQEELAFMGRKLTSDLGQSWLFVFLYTLTPLSTSALFTAAALAKVKALRTLPPFFLGKFASDALMIFTGRFAYLNAREAFQGSMSGKGLLTLGITLLVSLGFLFVDWRSALEEKQFRFNFKIWK